jgi:hypothetical protein
MPSLEDHHSSDIVKLLVVGDSGAGKTGGLASLVDAGYNLRIMDLEDKLRPLRDHVKKREHLKNVDYQVLKDSFKITGTKISVDKAASFQRAMELLKKWGDFGNVESWGNNDVLVIDSLSQLGRASLNMVLLANGVFGKPPELQHWGVAMDNIEKLLANLTNSTLVPCHVIVLTHVTWQETEAGITKPYPEALGTKLNPKVARYFDNMISLSLTSGERSYKLKKDGQFACKTSKPMTDEKLPLETGMAELFKRLRG